MQFLIQRMSPAAGIAGEDARIHASHTIEGDEAGGHHGLHPSRNVVSKARAKQGHKKPVNPNAATRIMISVELPRSPSSLM